jgi:TonB family protein
MHRRFILLVAALVALSLLSISVSAQNYDIRLTRSFKVGDKHHYTATGSQLQRAEVTAGSRVLRTSEEKFTYELSAEVTILETDGHGHITSESLVISNFKLLNDGTTSTPLPQGAVVVAAVEGDKTVFKVNGKPVDTDAAKVLSAAVTLFTGGPDDDEILGTRSRKRIGENWPINVDAASAFLKEIGAQAKKEDIKGTMTLEGVRDNHLHISGAMAVKPVEMSLPSEFKAETGEFRGEFSGRFPMKESNGSLQQAVKAHITMVGVRQAIKDQPEMRMKVAFESTIEDEIKPSGEDGKAADKAASRTSAGSDAEKTATISSQSGEAKTVWIIPAGFKDISPYEFVSVPAPSATPPPGVTVKTGILVVGKATKQVEPAYPPLALKAKISGKVGVEIIVDEGGNVIWAKASSGHPLLREAAVEAARQWKYEPTTLDGTPVKVLGAITLNFGI